MEELRPPPVPSTDGEGVAAAARRIPALLAGYWAFGQFWGVWVIVIATLNDRHGLTYSENGRMLTVLSLTAVVVMAFVAPRLAPIPLGTVVPVALVTLANLRGVREAGLLFAAPTYAFVASIFVMIGVVSPARNSSWSATQASRLGTPGLVGRVFSAMVSRTPFVLVNRS